MSTERSGAPAAPPPAGPGERRWQLVLVVAGVVIAGVGASSLVTDLRGTLPRVALWSLGPAAAHDGLLAPVAVAGAWLAARVLPRATWPAVVGGVLASAGLLAVGATVITRPGALESVPSLLDRDYDRGLALALAAVWTVVAVVALVAVRRSRRGRPPGGPADRRTGAWRGR